ncbi:EGF-domain O-GlcNAc transferase isoform X3 [Tachypleus tridentatus]|uniref:EGF-domain O-GlcNAc transferase isoform X3 n=2 Tax=Tachypleus tridentatus TaxID=6853 RepID=UPI003FD28C0A
MMLSLSSVLMFIQTISNLKIGSSAVVMPYDVDLPPEHMAFYFNNNPLAAEACRKNEDCPYKKHLDKKVCWGYEEICTEENRYFDPVCQDDSKGWVKSKKEQTEMFFNQGDFGYIKERKKEMKVLCGEGGSLLECASYTRFCRAKNVMFDFKKLLDMPEPMRYREDVIGEGQVGGYCKLDKKKLKDEGHHKSPLQSWFAELEHFVELPGQPIKEQMCDAIIDRPTFILKLDATVNMYHHFCDFFNLYASLHLNNTFSKDVYIFMWDTIPYRSNFGITWKAFTNFPLLNLGQFKGQKVCFMDAVFPLLPRMIFGMYYNMPLVPGCQGSGLFHAFNRHIIHRLGIIQQRNIENKVRITLLTRSTQYRRILNEDELIKALEKISECTVQKVNFNGRIPFIEQLEISHNSDVLIGMHGAGLTHMLFQPDWAVIFEIFNCEDENCYRDLARLRGLKYITWEKRDKLFPEDKGHHPTLGAHAKFTNYAFDVKEFIRLVNIAIHHVKNHPSFQNKHNITKSKSSPSHTEL